MVKIIDTVAYYLLVKVTFNVYYFRGYLDLSFKMGHPVYASVFKNLFHNFKKIKELLLVFLVVNGVLL